MCTIVTSDMKISCIVESDMKISCIVGILHDDTSSKTGKPEWQWQQASEIIILKDYKTSDKY